MVKNQFPLPRIEKAMQDLEVFQYATVLDINMVHYTIRFLPTSQDMTTIVTKFGKFRYNRLPASIKIEDSGKTE